MPMDDARERVLAQYLDGSLTAEGKEAFERQIASDVSLRAEVDAARQVEESLRRNFSTAPALSASQILVMAANLKPAADTISYVAAATRATTVIKPASPWLRRVGIAAVFLMGVFGAWTIWQQVRPDPTRSLMQGPPPVTTAASYYEHKVADGFEPDWVCSDDAEFTNTFRTRLGQGLSLKTSSEGTKMLGMDYMSILSPKTVGVLGEHEGKAVLVLVDTLANDSPETIHIDCANLRVYRKQIGDLVLYELNTLPQAEMLDLFELAP